MTSEEVAARFLTLTFPWVFSEKQELKMARAPQAAAVGGSSNRSKDDRRDEKRSFKRDTRKRFSKGFRDNNKK
jgi:hypothetical protein